MIWQEQFNEAYEHGTRVYGQGVRHPEKMFEGERREFLASIGCTPRELFDYVEDFCDYGAPDYETVLEVTAIRYRYFREVMNGQPSGRTIDQSDLPPKKEAVDGIRWLPRIIEKARAKLRGELDDDTMYGCGGDRPFLASVNMTLPQFLQLTRDAGDDTRQIIETVKQSQMRTLRSGK